MAHIRLFASIVLDLGEAHHFENRSDIVAGPTSETLLQPVAASDAVVA